MAHQYHVDERGLVENNAEIQVITGADNQRREYVNEQVEIEKVQYSELKRHLDQGEVISSRGRGDGEEEVVVVKFDYGHFGTVAYKSKTEPEEAKNLIRYRHTNLLQLVCLVYVNMIEAGIVCEYMSNGDLSFVIKTTKYNKAMVVCWLRQAAAALSYLQSHKLLHRDVKPSNMFIGANYMLLKIGDLGISKHLDEAVTRDKGTGQFVAPENLIPLDDGASVNRSQGNEPPVPSRTWNYKSDVYSLAVSAYYIVEQKLPYHQEQRDYNVIEQFNFLKSLVLSGRRPQHDAQVLRTPQYQDLWNWLDVCTNGEPEKRHSMLKSYNFFKQISDDSKAEIRLADSPPDSRPINRPNDSSLACSSTASETAQLLPTEKSVRKPGRCCCMSTSLLVLGLFLSFITVSVLIIIIDKNTSGKDGFYVVQQFPTCFEGTWSAVEFWPVKTPKSKRPYEGRYTVHFLKVDNPIYAQVRIRHPGSNDTSPSLWTYDAIWHGGVRITLLDRFRFRREEQGLSDEEWICIDGGVRMKNDTTTVQFKAIA